MGLKRPLNFWKEKIEKLNKGLLSTYLFSLLGWLSYFFSEQVLLSIYPSSQSVGELNYFLPPLFLILLDAFVSHLNIFKPDKMVLKSKFKVQFFIFFVGHISWGLFIALKSAPIINGYQAIVLFFVGLFFLVGRVGFIGTLFFSLIYFAIYSSFLHFLESPAGTDDKLFFFFYLLFSISFSLMNHFINKVIQKEKRSRDILKRFNEELEKSVKEKTSSTNNKNCYAKYTRSRNFDRVFDTKKRRYD